MPPQTASARWSAQAQANPPWFPNTPPPCTTGRWVRIWDPPGPSPQGIRPPWGLRPTAPSLG